MKRLLTLSVAALALTAAATTAQAADGVATTTVKTTTTKTTTTNVFPASAVFPATAHEYLLKDGSFLVVDGRTVWAVDVDGGKTPADDGDHILADDKTITTKHGHLIGGVPELGTLVPAATSVMTTKVPLPATTTSITTTSPVTDATSITTTSPVTGATSITTTSPVTGASTTTTTTTGDTTVTTP